MDKSSKIPFCDSSRLQAHAVAALSEYCMTSKTVQIQTGYDGTRDKGSTHAFHNLLKSMIKFSGRILIWDSSSSKVSSQLRISGRADQQMGDWDEWTV